MNKLEILEDISKRSTGTGKEYLTALINQLDEAKKKVVETCHKDSRSETFIHEVITSFNESIILCADIIYDDDTHPTIQEMRKLSEI